MNGLLRTSRRPIMALAVILFLLIGFFLISYHYYNLSFPVKEIYYSEEFSEGLGSWKGLDIEWLKEGQNGIITLSKKKFATPYAMVNLSAEQAPPTKFVWHFRTRVSSFTNNAVTLGTLIFPTGQITIFTDQAGRLGLADNLFNEATYSVGAFEKLKRNEWQDLYIIKDDIKRTISLFNGGIEVLEIENEFLNLSPQELWLGAIWLNGSEDYGAPLNISYDTVELGNEGILKKSYWTYLMNLIKNFFSHSPTPTGSSF
jgi:hypothetical protein